MASKILMISANRELSPQPVLPIGAAWVAQALHLAGFQVRLLDLCFEKDPVRSVLKAIESFKPDGIGISVRNLDNCDFLSPTSFMLQLKEITDSIKRWTDAPVLLGGAAVSIMPLQVLEYLKLEFAVVGEGEKAAPLFFQCKDPAEAALVPGVVARTTAHPPPPALKVKSCEEWVPVVPALHRWVDTAAYLKLEPVLPIQGKRGCAGRCLYCTYNRIEGNVWRVRDPGAVADEIAISMSQTGATEFEFVDSVFNEPEGYLEALFAEILRRQVKAKFRIASLSPKGLTKAQVDLMERAGVDSLVITPESACDVTLTALRKDFTARDVYRAAELLSNSSIKVLWCFLLGGPGEDEMTLDATASFINGATSSKDCAFITTGIRIYPGTGLHGLALTENMVDATDNLLMPKFYFSQKLTPEMAKQTLKKKMSDLSRCIFLSDTQLGPLNKLRRIGTMLRLPGPFWSYAGYLNNIAGRRSVISRKWTAGTARWK